MKRVAFTMKLKAGCADEYRRRHNEIWPGLKELLKETGIQQYSIFLDPRSQMLFAVLQIGNPEKLDLLPQQELMRQWWTYMKDIMDTHPDHSPVTFPLEELFYLP